MNFDCIVTQVHIPEYDVQGSLTWQQKTQLVSFGLKHLRRFNPNTYIILTGHGRRPDNVDCCDYVYWEDECRPLDQHGYVIGMPAQYLFVSKGIDHARAQGFQRLLKTRGDCIIGIPRITAHCQQILAIEQKALLITQQTGPERLGDCFMFGDADLLARTWAAQNQVVNADGLQNTAYHFRRALNAEAEPWRPLVQRICAFRDVHKLKFTCLRWNFHQISHNLNTFNNQYQGEFEKYHWGRANGWHFFDEHGKMTGSASWLWSQRSFYEDITAT